MVGAWGVTSKELPGRGPASEPLSAGQWCPCVTLLGLRDKTQHNTLQGLKTPEIHPLDVLEARTENKVSAGLVLLEAPRGICHTPPLPSSGPSLPGTPWVVDTSSNHYLHLHMAFPSHDSPFQVPLSFLLQGHCLRFGVQPESKIDLAQRH